MEWPQLLSTVRVGAWQRSEPQEHRSHFERDAQRVLYSTAFRRLNNKTQVFPMPENDHVHSRLTHSLEVASVGKILGKTIGHELIARYGLDRELPGLTAWDFGELVTTACLAHDLGNPPFGHSGEDAIGAFFRAPEHLRYLETLDDDQRADLMYFEGNAQGLRIIMRTENPSRPGGMQLTCAAIGAFSKYPQASRHMTRDGGDVARRKYGFFAGERELFGRVADGLGMPRVEGPAYAWRRHPLAFLLEAADDLCYLVLDLEDAVRLRLVGYDRFVQLVQPMARVGEQTLASVRTERERIAVLRGEAINTLVREIAAAFLEHEAGLLAGTFRENLTDCIPSTPALDAVRHFCMTDLYVTPDVVKIQVAGYEVINLLMRRLLDAALRGVKPDLTRIVPSVRDAPDDYEKILRITDFISGMTDRFAVSLFRELSGMALPAIK